MNEKRTKPGIAAGILLIGLGMLVMTGNWWPGIIIVLGLAAGADRAFRGNYIQAMMALALCSAIILITSTQLPWSIFGSFILIALGAVLLAQGVWSRQD